MRAVMRLFAYCAAVIAIGSARAATPPAPDYEHLLIRNTYTTPEEVMRHYCARDASGFVWSGLLDAERRAFTTWSEAPSADSFYVAQSYRVGRATRVGRDADLVTVPVTYELLAISDANGTRTPAPRPELQVAFELRKIQGRWKITAPEPARIAPVVLESKFPRPSDFVPPKPH